MNLLVSRAVSLAAARGHPAQQFGHAVFSRFGQVVRPQIMDAQHIEARAVRRIQLGQRRLAERQARAGAQRAHGAAGKPALVARFQRLLELALMLRLLL
jgi:hypothetical protein